MPVQIFKADNPIPYVSVGPGANLAQLMGNDSEEAPLSCGFFTMEPGSVSESTQDCTIFSIMLEGEYIFEDKAKPGETITFGPMDIFRATKGDAGTWRSPKGGKSFYVIQLPKGTDPTPYVK